jgi:K+-transporting ATPase KdpF subunit
MINSLRKFLFVPVVAVPEPAGSSGYMIGGIIALLILLYLIYSIAKPEKF